MDLQAQLAALHHQQTQKQKQKTQQLAKSVLQSSGSKSQARGSMSKSALNVHPGQHSSKNSSLKASQYVVPTANLGHNSMATSGKAQGKSQQSHPQVPAALSIFIKQQ